MANFDLLKLSTMSKTTFVARFKVDLMNPVSDTQFQVVMSPVTNSTYGDNGENSDNSFARYTPSGRLEMNVNNPDLAVKIKVGQVYDMEFKLKED